jgi:hypothetical protein
VDLNQHEHLGVEVIHYVNDANEVPEDALVDAHAVCLFETIWLRLIHRRIIPDRGQPEQGILNRSLPPDAGGWILGGWWPTLPKPIRRTMVASID